MYAVAHQKTRKGSLKSWRWLYDENGVCRAKYNQNRGTVTSACPQFVFGCTTQVPCTRSISRNLKV